MTSGFTFSMTGRAFGGATRDDESLTLQIPSDGGVGTLRAVLDRLETDAIEVGELSLQVPDLDDVFLSMTGAPAAHEVTVR
jgi:ABC-2 type transport system ATP-binding protein